MVEQLQERILLAGMAGSGKTYAWLTLARMFPDRRFYVIDPDDGARRVWFKEFPEVKNIEYYFTPRWYTEGSTKVPKIITVDKARSCHTSGIADAWKTISPKLKAGDWLIIEHLGNIWGYAQTGFADEIFAKDIGQYFLEARKEMKSGSKKLDALKGWTDWGVINKLHNEDFIIPVCYENPAHVLLTSSVSTTTTDSKEDPDTKDFYGDSKVRIDGQKGNVYRVQTVLLMTADTRMKPAKHFMSTFQKDRGREWIERKQWEDFAIDYLYGVGGWEF